MPLSIPRPAVAFVLANLAVSSLVVLPFVLELAPSLLLMALVPLVQWSVAAIAWTIHRRIRPLDGQGFRSFAGLVPGRDLWRTIVLALAVVAIVPMTQLVLALLLTGVDWQPRAVPSQLLALPVFFALQALLATGEEIGWRGWLHTTLRSRWGIWSTAAFTGAVWTTWHVPVALELALHSEMPSRVAITYVLDIAPWAFMLAALRERSGSIWPAVVAHGALNSLRVLILQNFTTPESQLSDGQFWALHAIGWALWLAAGWLLIRRSARTRS